jgi:MFS family permease
MYSFADVYVGLVALQANSKDEDRAVATGTRNVLRSLGGVVGIAVSTAAYFAVLGAALRQTVPSSLRERVLDGTWRIGEKGTEEFQSDILDARMHGFRIVFIIAVPLMALCLLASLFVADLVLKGDAKKEELQEKNQDSQTEEIVLEEDQTKHDQTANMSAEKGRSD